MLILFLTFLRKDHTISHSSYIILHSTNSSNFSTSLPALVIFCLFFDSDHPNGSEMVFCCVLICISLMVVILSIFYARWPSIYIFFGEQSIQVLFPFFHWVVYVFICYWFVMDTNPLLYIWFANTSCHSVCCLFTLFSLLCENVKVWCLPTCVFCLGYLCFWCHIWEIIANSNVLKFLPSFLWVVL